MEEFDELLDRAFEYYRAQYNFTGANHDFIIKIMTSDTMNHFSDEFRQLISAGLRARLNAFEDVKAEGRKLFGGRLVEVAMEPVSD